MGSNISAISNQVPEITRIRLLNGTHIRTELVSARARQITIVGVAGPVAGRALLVKVLAILFFFLVSVLYLRDVVHYLEGEECLDERVDDVAGANQEAHSLFEITRALWSVELINELNDCEVKHTNHSHRNDNNELHYLTPWIDLVALPIHLVYPSDSHLQKVITEPDVEQVEQAGQDYRCPDCDLDGHLQGVRDEEVEDQCNEKEHKGYDGSWYDHELSEFV